MAASGRLQAWRTADLGARGAVDATAGIGRHAIVTTLDQTADIAPPSAVRWRPHSDDVALA
jgi:hypothetical protein